MTQAKLVREKSGKFGLIVDGKIFNDQVYNHYNFTAIGRNPDGSRFDVGAELGITKVSHDEYTVGNLEKFLAWAEIPGAEPIAIYGVEDGCE